MKISELPITNFFKLKDDSVNPAPPEVYNKRLGFLALSAAMCSGVYGYDSGFIGGTISLTSFTHKFGLDNVEGNALARLQSDIVSTFQAGAFFGAIFAYYFNEKLGRRTTILLFLGVFMVGVTLQVASSGIVGLIYAGRALTGMTVGTVSMIVPIYNSEWAPPAVRGMAVGLYECVYQTMLVIAFWINYGVQLHQTGDRQWQIPFAVQFIVGGIALILMSFQPESYRWLIKVGKIEKARENLSKIRKLPPNHPYINYEITAVLEQINEENKAIEKDVLLQNGNFIQRSDLYTKFKEISKPGFRNRILLGLSVMIWQNLSGINALNYYSPNIFRSIGVKGTDVSLLATGVFGIVKAVTNILFVLFLVDHVGRRKPLLFGSFLTFFCMLYLAVYSQVSGSFDHTVKTDGGSRAALASVYLFAFFYAFSWNGVPFIFCSEVFPHNVRNFCMSLCVMMQWVMQFVIVYSNPYMMANIKYGTFYFFAAFLILSVPFTYFLIPETKGISLENMDIMFNIKGTARTKRHKADEIIEMRRAEGFIDDDGKVTITHKDNVDNESLEKVPTTSTKSRTDV